jgi:dCTP deaminase
LSKLICSLSPNQPDPADSRADSADKVLTVLLSDRDIAAEVSAGRVKVEPFSEGMIQPSSVDVRLDRFFRVFENHKYSVIDPSIEQAELTREVAVNHDEHFILHPGEFVLASTYEIITLPDDIAGRLEGKSSLGRLGLLTHSTAGFIDPGFSGHITLELSNVANLPVKLFPGMKIGQLCLIKLSSPAEHPYGSALYGSRYQGQRGPTPSKSWLNFYQSKIQ